MTSSLIPAYKLFLQTIKEQGITAVSCEKLFKEYGYLLNNDYDLFKLCLDYLEQEHELSITRINVGGVDVFQSVSLRCD